MPEWPIGGGEAGRRIRTLDWGTTPLGPIESWPQSLRTVVELTLAARQPSYIAWGPELTLIHNDALAPILGERYPDALGQPLPQLFDQVWDEYAPLFDAVLQGDAQHEIDQPVAIAGRAGVPVSWFTFALTPLRDDSGNIAGVFCAATETTEQVRAERAQRRRDEAALRESEGRYRYLFEAMDEGFCIIEMIYDAAGRPIDFRWVEANPAFVEHTGIVDPVGRRMSEVAPDLEQYWYDVYGEVDRTGAPTRLIRQAEALGRWFDVSAFRIGRPAEHRIAVLFSDISARRQAELRLAEIFKIRTVAMVTWDREGRLIEANDAFLAITGFTRDEAIGRHRHELIPQEFMPMCEMAVAQVMRDGESSPIEKQYYRKDGSTWWGLSAARRIDDDVVELVLDITERREAEKRLRELKETLEIRVEEEVAFRLQAEEAMRHSQRMEAIGQLTGGVAHDFNNLLTVIRSSTDLLRRGTLSEERRKRYIDAIAETADRAAKLTGQLLAFARRQALKPETFNVCERVEALGEMLHTIVGTGITLTTDTACEICYAEADVPQFETAIVNMAVNARDAMAGVGRLTVKVRPAGSTAAGAGNGATHGPLVAISVTDTGCGIAPEAMTHIFEPFYTTKEVGKGTGLGLSQVYGFAKQSGGEVEVESHAGQGTTFTIYLPRVAAPGMTDTAPATTTSDSSNVGHILVVEDDERVGEFSTQMLHEVGFETTWATSADAALALLEQDEARYAAVFSDVVMPGMSGVELGREIERRGIHVPVVLTSGYSHVLASDGSHGFDLLHKPYSVEELTRVIRGAIGQA
jgi:PAS domain S-box-containing protein